MSCRDEVMLEVSFAAIWLAVAHRTNQRSQQQQEQDLQHSRLSQLTSLKDPRQQQQQAAQRLNTAALLLFKWLLFRLLLVTSTFSATYLCGQDPVLQSCWKTVAAHGLPHALTR
jgi:Flp pilus assembly protein TadB